MVFGSDPAGRRPLHLCWVVLLFLCIMQRVLVIGIYVFEEFRVVTKAREI